MIRKTKTAPLKVKSTKAVSTQKNVKRDNAWSTAVVGICIMAILVLFSGFMINHLTQRLLRLEGKNGVRAATNTRMEAGQNYFCERDLSVCKRDLLDTSQAMTSSSLSYVLDSGALLTREWSPNEVKQDFWLVSEAGERAAATSVKRFVGRFEVLEGPGDAKAFSIKRLSNGLYEFIATADYTEAGSETVGFIDPKTLDFLTFTDSSERSDGLAITTPAIADGFISPHFSSESCATSSQAVVDRLDWNDELLYKFRKPPTIKCFFREMGGGNVMQALARVTERSISRDLKSFVLSMQTGQKLRLQFKGASKPTVTVVP